MASFPYILSGTVTDSSGTALASVRVWARNENSNKVIYGNTDSIGFYALDAANFATSYNNGDIVTVFVVYVNSEDYEEHVIDLSGGAGGATINLSLVEVPASGALRYFTVQDFFDVHGLTPGSDGVPLTNTIVKIGIQAEEEVDRVCSTRFSDGAIEVEVNDCDSTSGWSGSTDAVAIAVTTDDADYKTRTGALDLGKSGTTEALFSYSNSSLTARDWSNKYVLCWVYLSSLSALRVVDNGSAITIRYGSSSVNYYSQSWYYSDLVAGWNLLFFKKSDREVVTSGSPSDSNMTYFLIRFDVTAAATLVTTGTYIIDNIFLAHEEHLADEYLDTKDAYQYDYYVRKYPIDRIVQFQINRGSEGQAVSWDELTEIDNEVKIDKKTGRIRIVDNTQTTSEGRKIYPETGVNMVRVTYLYGENFVPKDIKKLALLMTARDLMKFTVSRALLQGQDSFKTDHYTALDSQIDSILIRYRQLDMINV